MDQYERNGEESLEKAVEDLSQRMDGKVVVSIDEINWEEAGKELEHSILLKLANNRSIQKKSLMDVLERVWKLAAPASFYKVEKNIMLIKLACKEDQEKVLEGGPWFFEGTAILLQKWEPGMTGEDFESTRINVWVHIHGLPFELRSERYAMNVAQYAGRVRKPEETTKAQSDWGEFMKFRIEVDTAKPILPGLFLKRIQRKPTWIFMKYEKLPNVCYQCGRMNHETKMCKEGRRGSDKLFGGWLKAEDQSIYRPSWTEEGADDLFLVISPPLSPAREEIRREEDGTTHQRNTIEMEKVSRQKTAGLIENSGLHTNLSVDINSRVTKHLREEKKSNKDVTLENEWGHMDEDLIIRAAEKRPILAIKRDGKGRMDVVTSKKDLGHLVGPFTRKRENSDQSRSNVLIEREAVKQSARRKKRRRKDDGEKLEIGGLLDERDLRDVVVEMEATKDYSEENSKQFSFDLAETGGRSRCTP